MNFLRGFSDELQVRHRDDISLTLLDFSVDVMHTCTIGPGTLGPPPQYLSSAEWV